MLHFLFVPFRQISSFQLFLGFLRAAFVAISAKESKGPRRRKGNEEGEEAKGAEKGNGEEDKSEKRAWRENEKRRECVVECVVVVSDGLLHLACNSKVALTSTGPTKEDKDTARLAS